jgi:hypothetical protein
MTDSFVPPELLRDLTARYAAEGYTPASRSRVPPALAADSGADLVFERGEELVLVQLKRSAAIIPSGEYKQLSRLAHEVQNFPNVRLDIVNVPDPMDALPDVEVIESRASAAEVIAQHAPGIREFEAALLLAASATEGSLVRLLRQREIRGDTSSGLAALAATAWSEGLMTKAQWDQLQRATDRRNAIAHGLTPGVSPDQNDIDVLVRLARTFANPNFHTALDLVDWFFEHYKDPADGVPFDSGEGGYQYISGGPYDADTVLANEFPDTPDEVRELAVEQIESYGDLWVGIHDY